MIPGGGWLKNGADSALRGLHEDLVWMLELTTLLFGVFDGNSEVGKGNVTFSIYSHWQLQQKWIELHKYDIYLNIYTAVVRAGDRPSLYLFYYFPSTIVLTESSSLWPWSVVEMATNSEQWWREVRRSGLYSAWGFIATGQCSPYKWCRIYSIYSVSTVSTQAGARFCHIYCPPPRGSLGWAGLGWAGLADWAGIIWTKKLKYARIYILQWPGPAQHTAVGGGWR